MRLFFLGPRILGIRPGISLGPEDLRRLNRPKADRVQAQQGSFIYVMKGDHGYCKIGVSRNPLDRLATLHTASPVPLSMAYVAVTPGDAYNIEALAHAALAGQRVNGEWFNCSVSQAVAAVSGAAYELGEPIQPAPAGVQPAQFVGQILQIAASAPAQRERIPWGKLFQIAMILAGALASGWFAIYLMTPTHP